MRYAKQKTKIVPVVNAQGQVIYQQGTGGSFITARNVECIKVIGPNSEVLFRMGC